MGRHSMQPLTGSQRQIVTDPELGCNKDCWRDNPDGSINGYSIVFDDVKHCLTSSNTSGEWP